MSGIQAAKKAAAEHAVSFVEEDMVVGLGTGSTAYFAIQRLGEMVSAGFKIQAVATSLQTEKLARENCIPLMESFEHVDVTIDGADEVDGNGYLIKGGGGALTREKIVAAASSLEIIIVDPTKRVDRVGEFPLPVEVIPFGHAYVATVLRNMGCSVQLREQDQTIFRTDNENYILDCSFGAIDSPETLALGINSIPGVVENGLFIGLTDLVLIGSDEGMVEEEWID